MSNAMIILCESFDEMENAYAVFMDFLETFDCFLIKKAYEFGYAVDTVEDIRYIFTDYHYENVFRKHGITDIIDREQFFDGLEEFYYFAGGRL